MDSRLFWLAVAAFVGATEGGMIAGLMPEIASELGVSTGQSGLLVLGYSIAYAIGTPLLAVLLGGVGRRRVLAGAEFGLAICALLMAVSQFFPLLVGVRTVLAVCAGTYTGTAIATAAMIAAPGQRGRSLQIVTMGQSLATLIGVPLGAWVAAHLDWRLNYAVISGMAFMAAAALFIGLPRGMHGDTQSIRERIRVMGNPGVVPAIMTTLLFMCGAYPPIVFVGAVMSEAGIGSGYMPLVLLANGVGAVGASFTAGRIADRFGNRPTVVIATLAMVASIGLLIPLPHLPQELRLPTLLFVFMVFGYLGWGYWIAHCSEMAHLAPSSVPLAISLNLTTLNIGVAIAAAAGGYIVDRWGASALSIAGLPIAASALIVWQMTPKPGADVKA